MKRAAIASTLVLAGLGLAGCASDYGYGRGGYGYGYNRAYYGYDGGFYPGYGSYFGWYNGFYYPGTGFYVYDRYRRPYRWDGGQQRYWQGRAQSYAGPRGGPEWRGFSQPRGGYGGQLGGRAYSGQPRGGGYHGQTGFRGGGYQHR